MYLTIEQTADYLDLPVSDIYRLIREKQVRYITVDDEVLLYKYQFEFYLQQRQKALKDYQEYLNTPLPDDVDIKDED